MPDPTTGTSSATRLRTLLEGLTAGLAQEAVTEATSLGHDPAAEIVTSLVEAELTRPTGGSVAIRAVHLAHELRLARAVPSLVRCLEMLPEVHPLHRASLAAIARYGVEAADPLLAAFDRCSTLEGRARIAEALARTGRKDDRIRAAFVRMLEDDPANGARHLEEHGDWRSVVDLGRAVDRLVAAPVGDCDLCSGKHLTAIASAIRVLGGTLSEEQREGIDRVLERRETMWTAFEDSFALPREPHRSRAAPRPGRNDPCHCGSGKKYKRCHLEADKRDAWP
jgi:hypothetical protein